MNVEHSLQDTLAQLQDLLSVLSQEDYARPLEILGDASIGQHTRHIIEFFYALKDGYESGVINYDNRKRDYLLETSPAEAHRAISALSENISKGNTALTFSGYFAGDRIITTSYHRELIYSLEHAIHHMAIIRIAVLHSTPLPLSPDFGVAPATIRYRKSVL